MLIFISSWRNLTKLMWLKTFFVVVLMFMAAMAVYIHYALTTFARRLILCSTLDSIQDYSTVWEAWSVGVRVSTCTCESYKVLVVFFQPLPPSLPLLFVCWTMTTWRCVSTPLSLTQGRSPTEWRYLIISLAVVVSLSWTRHCQVSAFIYWDK